MARTGHTHPPQVCCQHKKGRGLHQKSQLARTTQLSNADAMGNPWPACACAFASLCMSPRAHCPAGHATVDIDDVAAAHTLAISIPEAHGRYLLAERGSDIPTWAALLR